MGEHVGACSHDDANPPRLRELFEAALEHTTPRAREQFVANACAGDPVLAARLRELLAAHGNDQAEVEQLSAALSRLTRSVHTECPEGLPAQWEQPPDVGPRFSITHRIGYGGTAVVFAAKQLHPTPRPVAIKVLRAGLDDATQVARFNLEHAALEQLRHPHVATVYEHGVTSDRRPFFVMEHIPGEPLDAFCQSRRMSFTARLDLLIQVADALQHAHRNGVIHRDVKPSNVLAMDTPLGPRAKVIDFGLAHRDEPAARHLTTTGQFVGSLDFASPEQAEGGHIDVRTDVHGMGMLAYTVLTQTRPYAHFDLPRLPLARSLEVIASVDPRPPAEVVTDPALARRLRGDARWVLARALEKDPERRYRTMGELLDDLRRLRYGQPTDAGPTSLLRRCHKAARTHPRTAVAAVVILAMVGAIGVAQHYVLRAEVKTRQVNTKTLQLVLGALIDSCKSVFAPGGRGQDTTVGECLQLLAAQAASELTDEPEVHALVSHSLANGHRQRGSYDAAEQSFRAASELYAAARQPDLALGARAQLGDLLLERGRITEAIDVLKPAHQEVVARWPNSPLELTVRRYLLNARCELGEVDLAGYRQCIADHARIVGADAADTFQAERDLIWALQHDGRLRDCIAHANRVLQHLRQSGVANTHPVLPAVCRLYAAAASSAAGDFVTARKLLGDMPDQVDRHLGTGHPAALDVRCVELAISLGMPHAADNEAALIDRLAALVPDARLPAATRRTLAALCGQGALRAQDAPRAIALLEAGRDTTPGFQNRIMGSTGELSTALGQAYALAGRHADAARTLELADAALTTELEATATPEHDLLHRQIRRRTSRCLTLLAGLHDQLGNADSAASCRARAATLGGDQRD